MEKRRRDFLSLMRRGAAAGVLLPLAGCGFSPLYAEGEDDLSVAAEMATVRIEPLRDRVGQQMHNFLRDRLNPNGQRVSPKPRWAAA